MKRPGAAVALALSLVLGGCGAAVTPTPAPTVASTTVASPGAGPSHQTRSAAPTPSTILALDLGRRPSGAWAVTFQHTGSEAIREVFVLTPACAEAACDIEATIQTYAGDPIGTGVFHYADGTYHYEADRTVAVDCNDGFESVLNGATSVSHTDLLIAGYRPTGTAVISVDIRGTRTVAIGPTDGSGCAATTLDYLANGEQTQFAAGPTPTPKPAAPPKVPVIGGSFFGSGAKVVTYQVSGRTTSQIIASIQTNGPWSKWIHARAEGLTQAVPKYRFVLAQTAGPCHIEITAKPAVTFTFTITLPSWSRPPNADQATVLWWASELQRVATHERHHVDVYRDGAARLTNAVAHSTCANVSDRLATIVKDINTQQCQFDLKEYGAALGLSLSSCLTH